MHVRRSILLVALVLSGFSSTSASSDFSKETVSFESKSLPVAGVFAVESYPSEVTALLEQHFERKLAVPFTLKPLATRGATRTYYYLLTLADADYFVKYGEKVDLEVANQLRLDDSLPIPPIGPGTSLEMGVLVRPVLSNPSFGYDLVETLHSSPMEVEEFISVQQRIFERAFLLYGQPANATTPSKFFTQRIGQRLDALVSEPEIDRCLKFAGLPEALASRELFSYPILYRSQTEDSILTPSICEMVREFNRQFMSISEIRTRYRIHGDMHPPNVVYHDPLGILFIDLSDICDSEDPCWDLGKWMNHVKRLHTVVQKRDLQDADGDITLGFESSRIELCDSTYYPVDRTELIGQAGVSQYASFLQEPAELIALRSKGAEFVANINTLKRHVELYPLMTKRLLCLIVQSYLEWNRAFNSQYVEGSSER